MDEDLLPIPSQQLYKTLAYRERRCSSVFGVVQSLQSHEFHISIIHVLPTNQMQSQERCNRFTQRFSSINVL